MFNYTSPESMGVSSKDIKKYIEVLERTRLSTHDIIIARGNSILYENYWAPFHKNFLHRMYSVTKSYVSLAIGCLEEEGKINLDDKIGKYFPKEIENQKNEDFRNQTIKDMLAMSTTNVDHGWFAARCEDRVQYYFDNNLTYHRPSATAYEYDSTGSFVLGALVERLTEKTLIEYLREKFLDEIGFSREAHILKCPGGHSWSDSALLCTATDLLKTARFVMNGGNWNGKQLLNEAYIKKATSKVVDNSLLGYGNVDNQGYGYQFWRTVQDSYFFNGMGCQFAICIPHKDMILIYNGDNQGNLAAKQIIIQNFFDIVVDNTKDEALEENNFDAESLKIYSEALKLMSVKGEKTSKYQNEIDGAVFIAEENPMGITRFSLSFKEEKGAFSYTNKQGDKCIEFGMCENVFGIFPEEGYSKDVGSVRCKGNFYKCAASAAWTEKKKLFIKVQIIDDYFGILGITIGFNGNKAGIYMQKAAEDFLEEYQGMLSAERYFEGDKYCLTKEIR